MFKGIAVTKKQEDIFKIGDIAESMEEKGRIWLKTCLKSTSEGKDNILKKKNESHRGDVSGPSSKRRRSFLKAPEAWQIKNFKIYTDREIEMVSGNVRAYQNIWNQRGKELCQQHPKKSRVQIIDMIKLQWREERTVIFKKREDKLPQKRIATKAGTISRNRERIEEAIQNLKDNIDPARTCFYKAELRKTQEAMRKNLTGGSRGFRMLKCFICDIVMLC